MTLQAGTAEVALPVATAEVARQAGSAEVPPQGVTAGVALQVVTAAVAQQGLPVPAVPDYWGWVAATAILAGGWWVAALLCLIIICCRSGGMDDRTSMACLWRWECCWLLLAATLMIPLLVAVECAELSAPPCCPKVIALAGGAALLAVLPETVPEG